MYREKLSDDIGLYKSLGCQYVFSIFIQRICPLLVNFPSKFLLQKGIFFPKIFVIVGSSIMPLSWICFDNLSLPLIICHTNKQNSSTFSHCAYYLFTIMSISHLVFFVIQYWQKEFNILFCSITPTNLGQFSKSGTDLKFAGPDIFKTHFTCTI